MKDRELAPPRSRQLDVGFPAVIVDPLRREPGIAGDPVIEIQLAGRHQAIVGRNTRLLDFGHGRGSQPGLLGFFGLAVSLDPGAYCRSLFVGEPERQDGRVVFGSGTRRIE